MVAIGGLQKNSLIDYPGKLSCVIFLSGCNFDCPYCHNPSLVNGRAECPSSLRDDALNNFLENRKEFLDGVVISGGEPTLQKNLYKLCETVKRLGYSVKLDTNGSRPLELKRLINEGLVDYIAMDIKTDPFNYDPLIKKGCNPEDLLSSILTIMESAPAYEFRTTCVKGFVDDRIIESIAKLIRGASLYALQQFRNKEVLHPEFFQALDFSHNEEELMHLKTIADPWVRECVIR
ncbi:anaerobic ribonucleoside-triphosphate reductase activating protein [Thermodesulfobacteriota bacterium]